MKSKFSTELTELVKNKVISEETALKIRTYYQTEQHDGSSKLFTVFGVLGSLLVGLGIILILAHNWDNFSRALKISLAFLPLVLGQLVTGYVIFKNKSGIWKEASATFLFFAIGCCIAMISQIYNIPGNLSTYVLTWTVLCLPLVYLLKSNAVAMMCIAFATFYGAELGYGFSVFPQVPWIYLLMITFLMPYYLRLIKTKPEANSTSLFNWLMPLSLVFTLGTFIKAYDSFEYLAYVILFGLFYNIGSLPIFADRKLRRNAFLILGSVGTVFMLLMASFDLRWSFVPETDLFLSKDLYVTLFLFLINASVFMYLYANNLLMRLNLFHYVFVIFTLLSFISFTLGLVTIILINILVLVLGLVTIKIGADKFHFGILNYGLLIISALIACRFFDTDLSYIVRGILFVSVGIGFFLTNYFMLKRKKSNVKISN